MKTNDSNMFVFVGLGGKLNWFSSFQRTLYIIPKLSFSRRQSTRVCVLI